MGEMINAWFVLTGAAVACGLCAAAMTFAVAAVCRWMQWAPLNITVNIYHKEAEE